MFSSPLCDLLGLSGLKLLPRGPEQQDFSAAIERGRGRPNHPHESVDPATGPWPLGYFHDYYAFKVGTGRGDYDRAVKAVSSWQHADALPWVSTNKPQLRPRSFLPFRRRRQERNNNSNGGLVIAARAAGPFLPFLPLWIVNPLKIVEVKKEGRASEGVPALGSCGGGDGGGGGEGPPRRQRQQQRRQGALFPPLPSSPGRSEELFVPPAAAAAPPPPRRCRPASLSRGGGRSFSVRATTCASHVLAGAESFSVFLVENEGGKDKNKGEKEDEEKGEGAVWFEVASFSRPAAALSLLTLPLVRVLQSRFREEAARAVAEAVREGE